jgi:hypothetical protein
MAEYLHKPQKKSRLCVVRLPAYAPDINPVEGLWANIPCQELADRSVKDLREVVEEVGNGFSRVHSENWLLHFFLHHEGLSLE